MRFKGAWAELLWQGGSLSELKTARYTLPVYYYVVVYNSASSPVTANNTQP